MYVDPFVAGVVCTILAEVVLFIVCSIIADRKKK